MDLVLRLTPALVRALIFEAERSAPEECCGLLLGHSAASGLRAATHIVPAINVTAGDRRLSYEVDPRALLVAQRWQKPDTSLLGVYHSHTAGQSALSLADERGAVAAWSYLVIALHGDRQPELKSYRCGDKGGTFSEEQITIAT